MDRLYLIRRKLESFAGPMTAGQMKESFQRMEFGLQDEVAGHCGRWITLENRKALQNYYPEVYPMIHQGIMDPWTEQTDMGKIPKKSPKKQRKSRTSSSSNSPSSNSHKPKESKLAYVFLVFALIAAGIAVFLVKQSNLLDSMPILASGPKIEEIRKYFSDGDLPGYTTYIQKHRVAINNEVVAQSKKTTESPWLPYLRFYAFQGRGVIAGLPPNILKGSGAVSAPGDCGLETWKKRWRSSSKQWADMVFGRKLAKTHWGRMMAWDPHWIRRRPGSGWLEPASYYGACVYMSYRAYEELMTDNDFISGYIANEPDAEIVIAAIRGRMGWLSFAANGTDTFSGTIAGRTDSGFLAPSYWTCLEASATYTEIDSCQRGFIPSNKSWNDFEKDRLASNLIRLTLKEPQKAPGVVLNKLSMLREKMSRNDPFTRFDFRAELKYLDLLIKEKGDVGKSTQKVKQEYSTVDFSKDLKN